MEPFHKINGNLGSATSTIRKRVRGRRSSVEDIKIEKESGNHSYALPNFKQSNAIEPEIVQEIPRQDLLMTPIVAVNSDETRAMDDSFIKRISLGAYAELEQKGKKCSTRTLPRRPSDYEKYYLCPSNTFVASNGEVYHVDPFQLPPPSEIAELFQEINQRRVHEKQSPRNLKASPSHKKVSNISSEKKYPSLPSEWMRTPKTSMKSESDTSKCDSDEEESDESFSFKKFSWRKFILAEMLGIGQPSAPIEPIVAESIDNFLSVPFKLECLITFGCFVAFDSFLYVITYLPIRFFFAIFVITDEVAVKQVDIKSTDGLDNNWNVPRNRLYDLMRGALLAFGCYFLSLVDMSRVYHYIRMQNTLKLYALTGMMEIIDKLLCSFGIDVLDSLFVKSRSNAHANSNTFFTFVVAAVYVVIHSSLYFLHMATLTVAINNQDQSLVTVLILNNFAEIKSSVLKKFDSGNLFQLACSDISERFKMLLFYTLIIMVGLSQATSIQESFSSYAYILLAMLGCEVSVDWIKHAFIAKFNSLKSSCYIDYSRTLRNDILNGHNDKITLDHSYTITKRLGMSQIPLGVVFFKFLAIGLSSSRLSSFFSRFSYLQVACCCMLCFGIVLAIKVFLAVGLVYYTAFMNSKEKELEKNEIKKCQAVDVAISNDWKRSVDALSNIERYTMLRGRING